MVLRMARRPRVHIPGGVYHVMLRGNGGQGIFFLDEDRYRWYLLMEEGVERYGHRIHGFCLMTNHVHLAVQVGAIPLSKIIQNLSFSVYPMRKVLESYRLTPAELAVRGRRRKPAEARGVIAALAVQRGVATLTAVARRYHRDVATLSEAVRRVQLRLNDSGAFRERYEKLADSINAIT